MSPETPVEKQTRESKDWDLIEKDWRAGVKTKQQMAVQYGVSRAAMDKRFAKLGITRDLGGKIRAKADALVTQSVMSQDEANHAAATERDIVEANAALQSRIILAHRTDIQRSRKLAMALFTELEIQTDNAELLEQFAEIMFDPDDKGNDKRNDLYRKIISLSSRAGTMKTLADTLRGLIAMERQAFGLDAKEDDDVGSGVEDVIKKVMAKHGGD